VEVFLRKNVSGDTYSLRHKRGDLQIRQPGFQKRPFQRSDASGIGGMAKLQIDLGILILVIFFLFDR